MSITDKYDYIKYHQNSHSVMKCLREYKYSDFPFLDIYFDTYDVDTTGATPRTMPEPPAHYHPIIKTMHRYFISLFYEIEDFFANHWGYFLIGFGLFVLLVIIPGIITQIYCDR